MKVIICSVSVALFCISCVFGDVYLHNPRGSNNRLNEKSANRRNANRAFDSQNNNRGGYNVGDKTNKRFTTEDGQYNMKYFQSSASGPGKSYLTIEWTNQHGCGGNEDSDPHKLNCNIVLQYMCQPDDRPKDKDQLRNGKDTNTQNYQNNGRGSKETEAQYKARKNGNVQQTRVYQESWEWYDSCKQRNRNKGLFTADQNLNRRDRAVNTRQNPGGTRRGYECPEERDYYPYWHPTPWKDMAILAENQTRCDFYKKESFNVKPKGECVEYYSPGKRKHWSKWNNQKECEANEGKWKEFTNYLEKAPQFTTAGACNGAGKNYVWGIPYRGDKEECLVRLSAPECKEAPWSRVNHLGNGREGVPLNYTWTIPAFLSKKDYRCVLRIRYNISTDDYDPVNTNASSNRNRGKGIQSPVQQNPAVDIGANMMPLRLAINTAQFGRTFQDRSHLFKLLARSTYKVPEDKNIQNLNVRGKRGNIVQVYPAVEYDFFPTRPTYNSRRDLVHIQWTGSNSHNNGNPGGDGQTGDAGEGTSGTDRQNIVECKDPSDNFPLPWEKAKMFRNAEVVWTAHEKHSKPKPEDVAASMSSAGYYACLRDQPSCAGQSVEKKAVMNNLLNNAPASYGGMLLKFKPGKYYFMCSRNNNFSNRSQKGMMIVK